MSATPAEWTIELCKTCGARIFFARTEAMRDMPLDCKPYRAIVVDPLKPGEMKHKMRMVEAFRSHFETCPQAASHRRPR